MNPTESFIKNGQKSRNPSNDDHLFGSQPDTLGIYIRDIRSKEWLTIEEEVDLFKQIEYGRQMAMNLATNGHTLTVYERQQCLLAIDTCQHALDRILKIHTKLVVGIAKRMPTEQLSLPDRIQEGNIGMIRATGKFDYRRGNKFSVYAQWWIRQAIFEAINETGNTIRLPENLQDQIRMIRKCQMRFIVIHGQEPTIEYLMNATGLPQKKVIQCLNIPTVVFSLDHENQFEDGDLSDGYPYIPDPEVPSIEALALENELTNRIHSLLPDLPFRERIVLLYRYEINGYPKLSFSQIGKLLGVSRVRAEQLEKQALKRLLKPANRLKLKELL